MYSVKVPQKQGSGPMPHYGKWMKGFVSSFIPKCQECRETEDLSQKKLCNFGFKMLRNSVIAFLLFM